MEINRYLDHAVLKPELTQQEVAKAIQVGIDYQVKTVCVKPCDIELAVKMCKGSKTKVCCVLDFPYGYGEKEAKAQMAKRYVDLGAQEVDMVMNYGYAKSGLWDRVEDEIAAVVKGLGNSNVILKVIFETSVLTIDEIKMATKASLRAGADFVKTSTGFLGEGATTQKVQAMLDASGGNIAVKASGGIRDFETAAAYIAQGCQRLGVGYSSTPVICQRQGQAKEDY